jgi:hypothetical protein
MTTTDQKRAGLAPAQLVVRVLIALALLIDALVHLHLGPAYQLSAPSGIGAGNLFRLEAAAAIAAAALVLVRPSPEAYTAALLVGLTALGAVLVYRYVNVPAFGPLPAMYEPLWSPEKILSALSEAFAAILAAAMLLSGHGQAVRAAAEPPDPVPQNPATG